MKQEKSLGSTMLAAIKIYLKFWWSIKRAEYVKVRYFDCFKYFAYFQ